MCRPHVSRIVHCTTSDRRVPPLTPLPNTPPTFSPPRALSLTLALSSSRFLALSLSFHLNLSHSLSLCLFLFPSLPLPPFRRHLSSSLSLPFFLACCSRSLGTPTRALSRAPPHRRWQRGPSEPGADTGQEEARVVCHSSLSSPISRQFHVVHKLSPSRARRTKVA